FKSARPTSLGGRMQLTKIIALSVSGNHDFPEIGPGMSPGRVVNLRGCDGKRRQQARKQGSEEAEAGEAQGFGYGQFRSGETALARREEGQVARDASEHGALA